MLLLLWQLVKIDCAVGGLLEQCVIAAAAARQWLVLLALFTTPQCSLVQHQAPQTSSYLFSLHRTHELQARRPAQDTC